MSPFTLNASSPALNSDPGQSLANSSDSKACWNCAVCGSETRRKYHVHECWIRECADCGQCRAEIQPHADHAELVYDDAYFQGGKAGYSDYLGEAALLRQRGAQYGRLVREYTPPGKMIDIGAAAGFLLQGFLDEGWTGRGLEPNPKMAAHACTDLNVLVEAGTLEDWEPGEHFDLVSMIQVVGHFANLRLAFQRAADATRPGGHWLIETWNRRSWTARLFGRCWHEYSPPSVLHWFTPETLRRLAADYGLQEVARGRPKKSLNGGHARSLLQYKLGQSWMGRVAGLPLRMIPENCRIPYPAEDLCWMLFQKG